MKGIPLKTVASMLGHKSTDMVERHYSHLIEGATNTASDVFANILDDKSLTFRNTQNEWSNL